MIILYYFNVDEYYTDEKNVQTTEVHGNTTENEKFSLLECKYCLDVGRQDGRTLFIGKYNRNPKQTIPVVIRRYLTEVVDDEKMEKEQRDVQALSSPINNHENFIQYFDYVMNDKMGFT